MHEMSLVAGLMTLLRQQAEAHGFERVKTVWLEVGCLSHADPEALAFCFEAASKGTLAEGARLEIRRPPGEAVCTDCNERVTVNQRYDPCPNCGGSRLLAVGGEDLRLSEIEVTPCA